MARREYTARFACPDTACRKAATYGSTRRAGYDQAHRDNTSRLIVEARTEPPLPEGQPDA